MTPEHLKSSILQYAIQGKLVGQRPEEGTAEELYQQIQEEKQKLIKEGKIKKEKTLAEITEDEIPFDIPKSWKWVHLNNIAISGLGKTLNKSTDSGEEVPYLCSINVYWEGINLAQIKTAKFDNQAKEKYRLQKGDLLICEGGEAGRSAIWNSDEEMYYQNALHRVRFFGNVSAQYMCYVLECYKKDGTIANYTKGIGIQHLVQASLNSIWLPLPPLEEQHRIVAKLEELLPYVDRYAEAYEKLEQFNAKFPEDMKKSILQYAIQGKLVEQRPEEGTAEELYQQIQDEKQKLIKEGKIKKEKPLAEITEDEIPFDIPESWKWVKLKEVMSVYGGKRIPAGKKLTKENTGHIYIRVSDMKDGSIKDIDIHYVPDDIYPLIKNYTISKNDVYITVAGTIGRVGLIPERFDNSNLTENANKLIIYSLNKKYVLYLMSSPVVQKQIVDATTKVGQPKLAIKRIEDMSIPLPPLEEQHRIVAKIEELLPYCERLVK